MADISALRELFGRCIASPRSSFYRNFYAHRAEHAPASIDEWSDLPLLTKADIACVPYYDRIFIDPADVDIVRLTSGTTASGVLAIPRAKMTYTEAESAFMPVDCYMGFLLPHRVYDNYTRPGARFVGGDPARLSESALIAATMAIEGIGALPSTLIAFAEHLSQAYDITRIRHLCFNGDVCTRLQRATIARLYPGATSPVSSYGSSETQGLCSVSTPHPDYLNALRGHPLVHYEIVDESGNALRDFPAEGELVVSLLYPNAAFPLIRYRTGDKVVMISLTETEALFEIRGRTRAEQIRFSIGTILVSEIERAIAEVGNGMISDFEATVTEDTATGIPRISLSITLLVPPIYRSALPHDIARRIERELRVSEQRTYAEAIERGACIPLACTIEGLDYGLGRKRRRLQDAREH